MICVGRTVCSVTDRLVLSVDTSGARAAEKTVEELKRQLHPKRAHTHDDAGDAHEMLA